ncbi:FG-GAP repeat domain-containing protein [Actinophytocola gossypii]|uniref:VCBS repeat-containing protein n=1 Tax=Actinophytocola gossypii TaxID=2812003 RepID=A0ABT2JJ03_9PSEU|nr:VCBS repeat-containing protein [Actinophytocola gossypii]MCT2587865.1 VCBS repeat-containing protein [Actinophytocola gossypii]
MSRYRPVRGAVTALAAAALVLGMLTAPATAAPPPAPPTGDHVPLSVNPHACPSIPPNHDPNVIRTVYQVGLDRNVSDKVMLAAFEAGWVESHMNNLPCGDKDSLGVFQQRPSQGWGTPEQIMQVPYAATQFFIQAQANEPKYPHYTAGQLAQSVQRSCCPERYDQAEGKARAMLAEAAGMISPRVFTGSSTDFDGDGRDDIVTFTHGPLDDVYVALSTGAGFDGTSVKWHDRFALTGETPLTGDFNGDGKDDIVTFTHGSLADVYVALSNGSSFGPGVKWHDYFSLNGEVPSVGDVNGDGLDDIVTFTRNAAADVYVALSTGSGFGPGIKWHDFFGLAGEYPGVADVNGDGRDDIVVFTRGDLADVYVALSNGSGFGGSAKWHDWFAVGGELPRIGDFNGDGMADIATFTTNAAADVFVALSNGSGFTGTEQKWNDFFALAGEFPYTGDFDGDGLDDIVTFTHNSLADVYTARSTGTGFLGGAKWHDFFGLAGETSF